MQDSTIGWPKAQEDQDAGTSRITENRDAAAQAPQSSSNVSSTKRTRTGASTASSKETKRDPDSSNTDSSDTDSSNTDSSNTDTVGSHVPQQKIGMKKTTRKDHTGKSAGRHAEDNSPMGNDQATSPADAQPGVEVARNEGPTHQCEKKHQKKATQQKQSSSVTASGRSGLDSIRDKSPAVQTEPRLARSNHETRGTAIDTPKGPTQQCASGSKARRLQLGSDSATDERSKKRSHATVFGDNEIATTQACSASTNKRQQGTHASTNETRSQLSIPQDREGATYIRSPWENNLPHYPRFEWVMNPDGSEKRPHFTAPRSTSRYATLRNQIEDPLSLQSKGARPEGGLQRPNKTSIDQKFNRHNLGGKKVNASDK